ncbi:MAG: TolC family protein [bacterium]|nr:TolC family protein [bacterium]
MTRHLTTTGLVLAAILTATPALALTLEEAVSRALARHPDTLAAEVQLEGTRLTVQDAEAQRWNASTDVNALQRRSQTATTGGANASRDQSTLQGNVALTVPLFTGFRITHTIEAARADLRAAEASRRQTRLEVSLQTSRAFWAVARTEGALAIQREALAGAEQLLELTRSGVRTGRLSASELDQAEAAVLSSRTDMLAREADLQEARVRLATLVDLEPGALRLDGTESPSSAGGPETPTTERPNLQAIEARRDAAEARAGIAEAGRWPQISVGSTLQLGNNPFDPTLGARGVSDWAGVWDARLTLSYDAFDWTGRIGRDISRARQEARRQELALERERRNLSEQARVAQNRLDAAKARTDLAARAVLLARKVLDWTTTRQAQGYATQLEVVQARNQLVTSRLQELQARIEARLARTELDHLTVKEAP